MLHASCDSVLTSARLSAAGLTVYDMCKAVDRGMSVEAVRLVSKRGGKSGDWQRPDEPA